PAVPRRTRRAADRASVLPGRPRRRDALWRARSGDNSQPVAVRGDLLVVVSPPDGRSLPSNGGTAPESPSRKRSLGALAQADARHTTIPAVAHPSRPRRADGRARVGEAERDRRCAAPVPAPSPTPGRAAPRGGRVSP